jgi:hypothetical protein
MFNEWRDHPKLKERFEVEYPDELQIVLHDGSPGRTGRMPEIAWVEVTGCGWRSIHRRVLSEPEQLRNVAEGSEILFIVPAGGEYPLQVSEKYLEERPHWIIHPCKTCGLSELLDAPSDLIRADFPNMGPDEVVEMFTARCGMCGDVQVGAAQEL